MTASLASGRRIEIGARVLPPLPDRSRIHIGVRAGDYRIEFCPSLGRRLVRWLPVGFLFFWLYGWAHGEAFALRSGFDSTTPLGVRIFLFLWTAGWTLGGLVAIVYAIGLAFRPANESLLLQGARLIWRPAYPLMARFRRTPRAFLRSLLSLHRRSINFPRDEIRDIGFVRTYDTEDQTPTDHLVLNYGPEEYELGADLEDDDLVWLNCILKAWMEMRA